jgi:hypothetical protein
MREDNEAVQILKVTAAFRIHPRSHSQPVSPATPRNAISQFSRNAVTCYANLARNRAGFSIVIPKSLEVFGLIALSLQCQVMM